MNNNTRKSHWNVRIVHRIVGDENIYEPHEVYYTNGVPSSLTVESVPPGGESLEELKVYMSYIERAINMPVLEYDYFCSEKNKEDIKNAS